ncbi:MAG: hypothetical protein IPK60_25445 [Sandaracinaceae bacterium]|jgi:hypothetical protein|nr:hypothetical protein [Sandaracinaceae bacterium]
MRFGAVLAASFFAIGCSDSRTLEVQVATGLVPGPEFALVRTDVVTAGDVDVGNAYSEARFGDAFARGRQVASFSLAAAGEYVVRVRLLRTNGSLLIQRRVRIVVDGDYVLVVHLTRDCVDVECPSPGGSPALTECLGGQCVDPRCAPPAPQFCPEILFCNASSDCEAGATCATPVCTTGVCEAEAIAGSCGEAMYCNPDEGCKPFPDASSDAGEPPLDGGLDDAAIDANLDAGAVVDSGVVCNTVCTPDDDPCYAGYWDCSGGDPVCARLVPKRAGSACGDGLVCDFAGVCIACETGAACVQNCTHGILDCSSGEGICIVASDAVAPGTTCTPDSYCTEGSACAPDHVCTATGICSACIEGASCAVGCATGTLNCASGAVCTGDGGRLEQGARCEMSGVDEAHCQSDGVCVACTEDLACHVDNVCQSSTVSCAGGAPVCTPREFQERGFACPDGSCNGGGLCLGAGLHAVSLTAGARHTCVATSGDVICFGDNSDGQLGTGDTLSADGEQVRVSGLSSADVALVAGGGNFSIALSSLGASFIPRTWGANDFGQLCTGDLVPSPAPILSDLGGKFESLCAGGDFGCLLEATDSDVYCWGNGIHTGTGETEPLSALARVSLPSTGAFGLSAGGGHACAVLDELVFGMRIRCWGDNDAGQLGNGSLSPNELLPVPVFGIDDAIFVAAGGEHTCALRGTRDLTSVVCWGRGTEGQLGNITPTSSAYPVAVLLPADTRVDEIKALASGGQHSCLISGGEVVCWGRGVEGQLGDGRLNAIGAPSVVPGITNARALALGDRHSCAQLDTSEIVCWGDNSYGQLGDGTKISHSRPELVPVLLP